MRTLIRQLANHKKICEIKLSPILYFPLHVWVTISLSRKDIEHTNNYTIVLNLNGKKSYHASRQIQQLHARIEECAAKNSSTKAAR